MEQITIDFKNAFDCSKKEKSKVCRSGYQGRRIKYFIR